MLFHIVLIEDEKELCEIFEELISTDQIKIQSFQNPHKAISYIQHKPVDLVFIDYHLPGMKGDEAARLIEPSIVKILLSGEKKEAHEFEGLFKQVFTKPYCYDEISALIQAYQTQKKG